MSRSRSSSGFSLIEVLIGLAVLSVAMGIMATLLVQNAQVNKTQQLRAQVQSSARSTMALVTQVLRTAGWDPDESGIAAVALDADPSDAINYIDVFADLDADGFVTSVGETVRIRHNGDRVEWRRTVGGSFETVGMYITNDADGDGTPEPMFTPDATPTPRRITVTITAASPAPDPVSGDVFRYTLVNDVRLRNVPLP